MIPLRKTFVLLALTLSPFLRSEKAFACSCFSYENSNERFQAYFDNADLVIQGIPMEYAEEDTRMYNVSVEKVWKGRADAYMSVVTAIDSATCGIELRKNERYIIFASKGDDGMYDTGLCSGTIATADGTEIIEWLEMYDGEGVVSWSPPSLSDCASYICGNGEAVPACTEEGHIINYLVAPCEFKGGVAAMSENPPSVSTDFSDVSETHGSYTAISYVKDEGIVQGYADGSYKPDQNINRAEFTKIMIGATYSADIISACRTDHLFSDVSLSDWFSSFVCVAKENGVVSGYFDPNGDPSGPTFKPGNFVNFAEASKIVVEAFGIETLPEDHPDVWWKPYVYALSRVGGLPTSFTDPNQLVTRGEMAEIIYRVKTGIGSDL